MSEKNENGNATNEAEKVFEQDVNELSEQLNEPGVEGGEGDVKEEAKEVNEDAEVAETAEAATVVEATKSSEPAKGSEPTKGSKPAKAAAFPAGYQLPSMPIADFRMIPVWAYVPADLVQYLKTLPPADVLTESNHANRQRRPSRAYRFRKRRASYNKRGKGGTENSSNIDSNENIDSESIGDKENVPADLSSA